MSTPPPRDAHALGRLEDLPQAYRDELARHNLVPLWPSLRSVLPPHIPARRTQPTLWAYADIRPLLMQAGTLTPIEKAERRVLVLANPGHGLEKMQASAAIYLGMQLLQPGEIAPGHRHTPNAVRMVVEGEGAWTLVNGEKCMMQRGDLILTPTGQWHEHGHDGDQPVVWLDVLDLPLVYYTETSYHENQPLAQPAQDVASSGWSHGGILPTEAFRPHSAAYPMLRYAWRDVRAALQALAAARPEHECVQITYVNPATGQDAQNILGFYALMLRPGQTLQLPARSPATVWHQIEGATHIEAAGSRLTLGVADTCCFPGYSAVRLSNPSVSEPSLIFIADEAPLHRKLGVYEERQ